MANTFRVSYGPPGENIRSVPPTATPVRFPCYTPPELSRPNPDAQVNIATLFKPIKRLTDFRPLLVSALNLTVERDVPIEQLVPAQYLPLREWDDDPAVQENDDAGSADRPLETLSSGIPAPSRHEYYLRKKEILLDNEDAFDCLHGGPSNPERRSMRATHFLKFWQTLHMIALFWGTSLDQYSVPTFGGYADGMVQSRGPMDPGTASDRRKAVSEPPPPVLTLPSATEKKTESNSQVRAPVIGAAADHNGTKLPVVGATRNHPGSSISNSHPVRYTSSPITAGSFTEYSGRRINAGTAMPPSYREQLIYHFLNPIIWSFSCRFEVPRTQPRIGVADYRIPVDLTGFVYRVPRSRLAPDSKSLEGPVMVVQCRGETKFLTEQAEIADLLREVGAAILTAQERTREGRTEPTSREQWFVTRRRWGGGSGEAIGTPLGWASLAEKLSCGGEGTEKEKARAVVAVTGESDGLPPTKKRIQVDRRTREGMRRTERRKREDLSRSYLPPKPTWDARVRYMRVGREDEAGFDNVSGRIGFQFTHLLSSFPHVTDPLHQQLLHSLSHLFRIYAPANLFSPNR